MFGRESANQAQAAHGKRAMLRERRGEDLLKPLEGVNLVWRELERGRAQQKGCNAERVRQAQRRLRRVFIIAPLERYEPLAKLHFLCRGRSSVLTHLGSGLGLGLRLSGGSGLGSGRAQTYRFLQRRSLLKIFTLYRGVNLRPQLAQACLRQQRFLVALQPSLGTSGALARRDSQVGLRGVALRVMCDGNGMRLGWGERRRP